MEYAPRLHSSLSGAIRLGVFLTFVWLITFPLLYALGLYFNPPFLHQHFEWAYSWWEDAPTPNNPLGLFQNFSPEARVGLAVLLTLGVPGILWLLLYALPKSIFWVVAGFKHE